MMSNRDNFDLGVIRLINFLRCCLIKSINRRKRTPERQESRVVTSMLLRRGAAPWGRLSTCYELQNRKKDRV